MNTIRERRDLEMALAFAEQRDTLLTALREIAAITDEDTGTFRKRGGTYRGIVGIIAAAAIAKVNP